MNYSSDGYNPSPENNFGHTTSSPGGPAIPHFVPFGIWTQEKKHIRRLSITAAACVLLFIVFSTVLVSGAQTILSVLSKIGSFDYSSFAEKWDSAEFQFVFEILYSVFAIGSPFFIAGIILHKKGYLNFIPMGKPENANVFLVILGAFGICLLGNIVTSYFNIILETIFGISLNLPQMPETPRNFTGVSLFYLSTAIVPALVEEMAFRGIIMQSLRRYGDWFAVICSSIIFGLMHCNLVQIPFAIIAGIAIGYAVIVTESVWTGIIIHFLNNAFSVTVSITDEFYGMESAQYMICNIIFYAIIVAGLFAAFIYFKKFNTVPMRKSPLVNKGKNFFGEPHPFSAKISAGTLFKEYLLTAPMVIAFIVIAYETVVVTMILQ